MDVGAPPGCSARTSPQILQEVWIRAPKAWASGDLSRARQRLQALRDLCQSRQVAICQDTLGWDNKVLDQLRKVAEAASRMDLDLRPRALKMSETFSQCQSRRAGAMAGLQPLNDAAAAGRPGEVGRDENVEVLDLPVSRFWPPIPALIASSGFEPGSAFGEQLDLAAGGSPTSEFDLADNPLWTEDFGLHPSSTRWCGVRKLVVKNMPARCKENELRNFIGSLTAAPFQIRMPSSRKGTCKGFCFIAFADPEGLSKLLPALWQQSVPNRSPRPLKLVPMIEGETESFGFKWQ
eukprot:s2839_g3.t1